MRDDRPPYAFTAAAEAITAVGPDQTEPFASKIRLCLLDFLSCAFEAADLPWSQQAEAVAEPADGGATIIGSAKRAVAGDAAFANAVRGHGLVREDMHPGSIAHLGIVVWPALLAAAEEHSIDGADFLAGALAGYEMGGRLGRVLVTPEVARLFRPTGLVGPVAAAASVCRAMRQDATVTANALSLAANTSGGLNQWPHHGADEMYFHPGYAVRNGLTAVRLAQAGAWSSPAILEGPAGLLAAFARKDDDAGLTLFPGGEAEITSVFNKEVPACNFAQSPAQAALSALRSSGRTGGEIASVRVTTYDAALNYPGCAALGPFETPLGAKMSIAFGVASALVSGDIAEANYSRLGDSEIARVIDATSFEISPDLNAAFPARQGAQVTLRFADGEEASHGQPDIVFAGRDLIERRFRDFGAAMVGDARIGELDQAIAGLHELKNAGAVSRLSGRGTEE